MEFSTDWQASVTWQMAKAMGLNCFCCLTSLQSERCLLQYSLYTQCIIHGLTNVLLCVHSSLLTNFVVGTWWFLFVMETIHNFRSGYFYYRGCFQTVVDSYCCITGCPQLAQTTPACFSAFSIYYGSWKFLIISVLVNFFGKNYYDWWAHAYCI